MSIQNYFVPFAYMDSFAHAIAQEGLHLPNLSLLLSKWRIQSWVESTELAPSLPHEHALLNAFTHPLVSAVPVEESASAASLYARQTGACTPQPPTDAQHTGWAFVTPCHWQVTPDRIILHDPSQLQLSEADARALFETVRDWVAQDNITLIWDRADRWLAHSEAFINLSTSSIERAIQRDVRPWLPTIEDAALLQRLQTEVQMLLYSHPLHDARMHQGLQPVNALWISGTGRLLPASIASGARPHIEQQACLQGPALHGNWPAWKAAWQALDHTLFAQLLQPLAGRTAAGQSIRLTLSGERCAVTLENTPAHGLWPRLQRTLALPWKKQDPLTVLKKL